MSADHEAHPTVSAAVELLQKLASLVEHLSSLDHPIAANNGRLADDLCVQAELLTEKGASPLTIFSSSEASRVALEVAKQLMAWAPEAAVQSNEGRSLPDPTRLWAGCVQAGAASAAASILLAFMPLDSEQLDAPQTGTAYRVLSACCHAVLGPPITLVTRQQRQAAPLSLMLPNDLVLFADVTLHASFRIVTAAIRLLELLAAACAGHSLSQTGLAILKTACKPETAHGFWAGCVTMVASSVEQLGVPAVAVVLGNVCQLTAQLIAGQGAAHSAAWGRWHQATAALVRKDTATLGIFMLLAAKMHHHQVRLLAVAGEDAATNPPLGAHWINTSAMLCDAELMSQVKDRSTAASLRSLAADAVAAVQLLLRLYLRGSHQTAVLNELLEAVHAACFRSWQLLNEGCTGASSEAGYGSKAQLPAVFWEGTALCCTALLAVIDRVVKDRRAAPASGSGRASAAAQGPAAAAKPVYGLWRAILGVGNLLLRLAAGSSEHASTVAQPCHAAAAAAAVECAARLSGRLWQGTTADQLRASVGSDVVDSLAQGAAGTAFFGPPAVIANIRGTPDPPERNLRAVGWLAASLASLDLLSPQQSQSGFALGKGGDFLDRMELCVRYLGRLAVPEGVWKKREKIGLAFQCWFKALVLRRAHACKAAADQAALQSTPAGLATWAADIGKLVIAMEHLFDLGWQARNMGLATLAGRAVQQLIVRGLSVAESGLWENRS